MMNNISTANKGCIEYKHSDGDQLIMAKTMFGEARGEYSKKRCCTRSKSVSKDGAFRRSDDRITFDS
jgi:hypothetical protein